MDYEFWIRLVARGYNFMYLNRFLSAFRHLSKSKTENARSMQLKESSEIRVQYGYRETLKDRYLLRLEDFLTKLMGLRMMDQLFKMYQWDLNSCILLNHQKEERALCLFVGNRV